MANVEQIPANTPRILHVRRLDIDDDCLAIAYLRAKLEGLLPYLFWKSPPKTVREFMNWCNEQVVVGCFCQKSPTLDDLAGLGIISKPREMGGRKQGDSSELFFREYHIAETPQFARMLLDWAFTEGGMDCLRGITPSANISALRFMRQVGYSFNPPIPELCEWQGKPCGGIMSWLTKEMWAAKKAERSVA